MTRPRKPSSARAADRSTHPRASSAWFITLAATAASTYALDAAATAAGVLLVASQLLNDLDHLHVLAFLAATYLLWGVTLRANLRANWRLLRRTGTSTNALSKAAFELTRRRGARTQKIAAGAGYVATVLAKEAPYPSRCPTRVCRPALPVSGTVLQRGDRASRSRVTVRRHVRERTFSREISLSVAGARQMRPQLRAAAPRRREAHSAP